MTVFEDLSLLAILLAGFWGGFLFLKSCFTEVRQENRDNLNRSTSEIGKALSEVTKLMDKLESRFEAKVDELTKKVYELKVSMAEGLSETKSAKEALNESHATFKELLGKMTSYQAKHIGEDAHKIVPKKKS